MMTAKRTAWWQLGVAAVPTVLLAGLAITAHSQQAYPQQAQPMAQDDATIAQQEAQADPSQDPPSQVARISLLSGNVSFEPASVNQFSPAEPNYPLTTGDRLWTDVGANAELQTGNVAVRLGSTTDLTVTGITDSLQQFGLGQGAVHLKTWSIDPNSTVELDTPNVAVSVLQPGDVRIDVDPNADITTVTVLNGQVEVDGNGLQQSMQTGESVRISGQNPVATQWLRPMPMDALDQFSAQRDSVYAQAQPAEAPYMNNETIGGEDMSQYGSWDNDADYGPVWYPSGVAVDWAPYTYGHWAWVAPWGWVWVGREPWGFAPYHYGRWNRFGARWGWIPGPPVLRPVWSPALVVFVGGPNAGLTAWFPLGPREPYVPWYHTSTLYVNRVNVTNIYTRNYAQVRTIYNQRTTNVFVNAGVANRTWINRGATVAVSHDVFAGGRPVHGSIQHVSGNEWEHAPILPHPTVTPERTMVAPSTARVQPPRQNRPVLESHENMPVRPAQTVPGQNGIRTFGQPAQNGPTAPIQRPSNPNQTGERNNGQAPLPDLGNPPRQQPPSSPQQQQNNQQQNNPNRSNWPARPITSTGQDNGQQQTPPAQNEMHRSPPLSGGPQQQQPQQPAQQQAPPLQNEMHRGAPLNGGPQQIQPPVLHPTQDQQQPQQLYNRAVPPESRPSFEQQQRAIQQTDPGRPLSPQQMNNVRQNQPAGPPQQREAVPHPQPQPQRQPPPPPRDDRKH